MLAGLFPLVLANRNISSRKVIKVVSLVIGTIFVVGVFLTYSRGGLLALAVGAGVWLAIQKRVQIRSFVVLLLGGVLVGNLFQDEISLIAVRFYQTFLNLNEFNVGSPGRLVLYDLAVRMVVDHPLLGVGIHGFIVFGQEVVHNSYLEVASGMGLIGLGIFSLIIWSTWREVSLPYETSLTRSNRLLLLSYGLRASWVAVLIGSLFLTFDLEKFFWAIVALCAIVKKTAAQNSLGLKQAWWERTARNSLRVAQHLRQ
jgi:O-antigen ligase